jgi:dolichyl-phosphate-mannose-protein mannosyltransferase
MGRQLFLHHYLPAHLASSLVTGALVEFIFLMDPAETVEAVQEEVKGGKKKDKSSAKRLTSKDAHAGQSMLSLWAAAGVLLILVIGGWYYFLPLTYGKPGLSVEQVKARKWLAYDLHFAK